MGILILTVVGAVLGWLSSIVRNLSLSTRVFELVALGVVAAIVAGLVSYPGSLAAGISGSALLLSAAICAAVLGIFQIMRDAALG